MDLRNKMLEMLNSTRVEESYEITGSLLIAVSRAVMLKANVYIWAENDLHIYVRLFKSWGLNVHKVVCTEPKDFQKVDDVEIISPEDLFKDDTPRKFFFMDALSYSANDPEAVWRDYLKVSSPVITHLMGPKSREVMISNKSNFDSGKMLYYQSHKKELMELFDSLADEISKRALYYYVESFVTNSVYKGEYNQTRLKYFFGGKYERLYKHLDGECWINCGSYIGDTIFSYLSWDFKPKKIYAFEANKKFYTEMLKNLSLLPPDKRKFVEPINQLITEQTDFEKILAGNKCTLLNADIEGAELNLLHAMKNVILNDRPVVAICVYHNKEDILQVPQFLQSNCKDYIYHLRKYTSYRGRAKNNGELVLYAVPVERSTLITPPRSTCEF